MRVPVTEPTPNQETATSARWEELEAAIRTHRDQRGDDRCWLDDLALYAHLPEGAPDPETLCLHEPEVMLANCKRFIASRQPRGLPYVSPQREIERLEALITTLYANRRTTMHPAVRHVLRFFEYEPPTGELTPQAAAQHALDVAFARVADTLVQRAPDSQETTVALRKLLEARDAASRATQP